MSPRARLVAGQAAVAALAVGGIASVGAVWYSLRAPSASVDLPGTGPAVIPGRVIDVSGADVAAAAQVLGVLVGVAVALAVLLGPKAGRALTAAAAVAASAALVAVLVAEAPELPVSGRFVRTGPGAARWLAAGAYGAAALTAAVSSFYGPWGPKLEMPVLRADTGDGRRAKEVTGGEDLP